MRIAIVTDSTSDLPLDLAEKYPIESVPAIIVAGDRQFEDGRGLTRREFYRLLPAMEVVPTTAAPSTGTFEQVYARLLDSGFDHLISIHLASGLSAMCNVAHTAASSFGGAVTVVDSRQLSMGLGFQVLAAAEAAQAGLDLAQVLERVRDVRRRVRLYAMIDSLETLRRSGRVSWLRAGLGALLRLRLFVEVRDGQVLRVGQARTRRRGLLGLGAILRRLGALERLAILHTAAEREAHHFLQAVENPLDHPGLVIEVTTVIGAHVGPRALGFAAVIG